MTVRGIFYVLVGLGVVPKDEQTGYKVVQRQVLAMRRADLLPWSFIADESRWRRKPDTYHDADDFLESMIRHYRRDLWQSQKVRIEIWMEKDALAGVLSAVIRAWDVSLMVSRGQSSDTFIYSAAEAARVAWEEEGVKTFIYTLYDFDLSGRRCHQSIAKKLPQYVGDAPVTIVQLALTHDQVTEWSLPTRPPKQDKHGKWHHPVAVELDAIPPDHLSNLVEEAIVSHIDHHRWETQQRIETAERDLLHAMLEE